MYYEVYADLLLVWFICTNACTLWTTKRLLKIKCERKRFLVSILCASVIDMCMLLPLPNIDNRLPMSVVFLLKAVLTIVLSSTIMMLTAFRLSSFKQFVRVLFIMLVSGSALAGCAGKLTARLHGGLSALFNMMVMVTLTYFLSIGFQRIEKLKRKPVAVILKKDKCLIYVVGIRDSGNRLTDKNTGKGICVMDAGSFDFTKMSSCGKTSYCAVGTQNGEMDVYCFDEMRVCTEKGDILSRNVFVAISMKKLSGKDEYSLILHDNYIYQT